MWVKGKDSGLVIFAGKHCRNNNEVNVLESE